MYQIMYRDAKGVLYGVQREPDNFTFNNFSAAVKECDNLLLIYQATDYIVVKLDVVYDKRGGVNAEPYKARY